jgi:hypothetical protein
MSAMTEATTEIRPFSVETSQEQIDNLRRRIEATRWPTTELVQDASQGIQLAFLQELARYWAEDYDFGRLEERLTRCLSTRRRSTGSTSTSSTSSPRTRTPYR